MYSYIVPGDAKDLATLGTGLAMNPRLLVVLLLTCNTLKAQTPATDWELGDGNLGTDGKFPFVEADEKSPRASRLR